MTTATVMSTVRSKVRRPALVLGVVATSVVAGFAVPSGGLLRPLLAAAVAFLLAICGLMSPRTLLVALVWWLGFLGLLRRLLSGVAPAHPQGDPLLLVAAVGWSCLALMAFRRGALTNRTRLAGSVLALTGVLLASAANPLQGGLAVELGGLLLVVVPMLAFWVGRSLINDRSIAGILHLVALLAAAAAVYGLVQTFIGLPSWDHRWVVESGYVALNVNGTTRAFSSFSSGSEYGTFLAVGIVCFLSSARSLRRLLFLLPGIALLATALWFESARGTIVLLLAALCLMAGAAKGFSPLRSILLGVAVLAALPFVIAHVTPAQSSTSASSQLTEHQVAGLSNPFGEASTLPGHIRLVISGVREAFLSPVGRGVGSVTIAASKFGTAESGAEADPGNVAIAAGLLGLAVYALAFVFGFRTVYRLAVFRRDNISLAALGILTVTLFQWLNGAQYAVAFLPWLSLGWADAASVRHRNIADQSTGLLPSTSA